MQQHINTIITQYITTMLSLQKSTVKDLCNKYGTDNVISSFKALLGKAKLRDSLYNTSLMQLKAQLLLHKAHIQYIPKEEKHQDD